MSESDHPQLRSSFYPPRRRVGRSLPIDVLPNELLLEIFTFGAHSSGNTSFSFLVSNICRCWRSLAIGEPCLWTDLTLALTSPVEPPPIPNERPFYVSQVFPREALIVERSANRDIDIYIDYEDPEEDEERHTLTEAHLLLFSKFLADHVAHRIRSVHIATVYWEEIYQLCENLHGIAMPHLETCSLTALSSQIVVAMDVSDDDWPTPVRLLEYAQNDEPMTSQDLWTCGSLLYPALKEVYWCGLPTDWARFCASNLRELHLQNEPLGQRPSMEVLRGIISNSKDTLECLELTYVIDPDELGDAPHFESRLTLPHVKRLKLVYIYPREAQQILRAFDFPALRTLTINSHNENEDSSTVLVDLLKYVPVERLLDLRLVGISLPPETFPERQLKDAEEESLPLILQLVRRLTRGSLHKLMLQFCCHDFLTFMNYGNESGGGKVNLSGLYGLIVKVRDEEASVGVLSFIRDRLKLGMVDGVYAGPVLEHMIIIVKPNVKEEVESLGEMKLTKNGGFYFRNVVLVD
ncbi:hypothetical protein EDD18DRAFT_1430159 [Armillaria luteobubalina]|uniref:F-box domain-containing protein n=1 Tax=Armillaria luteobubalina TaxID=153913 RepID=A0AA39UEN7_9AGAR|nr:hypothetical protein EDD18DRAFT_1430159 [Armillaria luteobubalina]